MIAERPAVQAPVRVRTARAPSRAAPRWRSLWAGASFVVIVFLTAAAGLVLLDWFLFETPVVAPRLPLGDDGSPTVKLLLADRYLDTEILYLGDSRVRYGVHPGVVSKACACGPGFNAAFPAADPRLTRIMADRILDTLAPGLVVVGVSQWELSDGADIRVWGPAPELVMPWHWDEFGGRIDGLGDLRDTLGEVWRTYRFRAALRVALDPWSTETDRTDPRRGFDDYSEKRRVHERDLDQRQRQWFSNFAVRGRRTEALRGLVADLRGEGIQVLLVAPPLYPNFHARVRREVELFRATMSELAAEQGVHFEDLTDPRRSGLTPDNFMDVVHVNDQGATKLSRQIAKVIRSRFGTS